ncbi:MAG: hypothetical protein WCF33_17690, partial [Pseudonocardiaceae bacterium]
LITAPSMVGRHRFITRRQLRAAMVEMVDLYTLTTHLEAYAELRDGPRDHLADLRGRQLSIIFSRSSA